MLVQVKRIIFFICVLNMGWGCGLGKPAGADGPPGDLLYHLYIASIFHTYFPRNISGYVSCKGLGLEGVSIVETNPPDFNWTFPIAITNGQGYYVTDVSSGRGFSLAAQKDSYQFDPPFRSIPVNQHDQVNQDFTAYHYTVSGKVTYNGVGLEGVDLYGTNTSLAVTDSQGNYQAEVCSGNGFTVTPQKTGYQFSPASLPITANQYNQPNLNFTAQAAVTISGNVTWKNISDYTTIQSNPLPGENNLTVPAIAVALEACPQDGSACTRIVANPDGTYSLPVPYNWSGSVKPSSLGFEFSPERLTYSGLKVNKTQQNFQAPLSPGGTVYPVSVLVKNQEGDLLPHDSRISIRLDGTNHAAGSSYRYATTPENSTWPFYKTEWTFSSIPSGWIGDIIPVSSAYTFSPASVRLEGLVTEGRTVPFTATPLDPIVFSGTIIWEYEWDKTRPLPTVDIFAVARDGAPFSYKVVTGADGKYSIPLPYYWSGSVTPASAGFLFNPATTTINNMSVDHEQNFWVRDTP